MSERDIERPSPEALLNEAEQSSRGQLKIFLGAAPGVGKTYAMLSAAQQRRAAGTDVVIGIVETHGRRETQALLHGLEAMPLNRLSYRGRGFAEMHLDAILSRRPALVLVDELAHNNIPGSRHLKRYQDVEELLSAGIDVYTTLNVQHLESLNDIVERIARVKVRETVPDGVLEKATEIELIDLPADELIQRLHDGKVYVPAEAQRAISHFFSRGNLTALRELAMRAAAERVDTDMLNYMRARAINGPWPTRARLLVCVEASPNAERLIRAGRRMAERRSVPWLVLHVERIGAEKAAARDAERLNANFRLAEQLGAEVVTLQSSHIGAEILRYAHEHNVTQLLLGRPAPGHWWSRLRRPLAYRLLEEATEFEVTWLGSSPRADARPFWGLALRGLRETAYAQYLSSTLAVILAAGVAYGLSRFLATADLSLVFLTAVLLVAGRWGLWPGLYTSLLSFLSFNFFFTAPYLTLNVTNRKDLLTLVFFLFVSVIGGNLAARVHAQMEAIRGNAKRNARLYHFSRRLGGAVGRDDLVWTISEYLSESLGCQAVVLLPTEDGALAFAAGSVEAAQLIDTDWAAARWAAKHNAAAGWSTGTLPGSRWLFLPLSVSARKRGVIGVTLRNQRQALDPPTRGLLDAMRHQAAIALGRAELMEQLERTEILSESDKLRSALLSSISHDLRTPLASIIGAASSLQRYDRALSSVDRAQLLDTVIEEAERLNRFVGNLLDMTRLSYGALRIKRDWCDLREIGAAAMRRLQRELKHHPVSVDMKSDAALVYVDTTLIEQVLVNLLDNAAKFSAPDTPVRIATKAHGERVTLHVVDQGRGIPPADRERVFDMFQRIKDEDTRTAGTGLGLGIARALVEAHGGTIRALAGDGGIGTCMEVVLPRTAPLPLPEVRQDA